MIDISIPRPLYSPELWPELWLDGQSPRRDAYVVDIELVLTTGGPLRRFYESKLYEGSAVLCVRSASLSQDPLLAEAAREFLRQALENDPKRFSVCTDSVFPSALDWLSAIAPDFIKKVTFAQAELGLREFCAQFPAASRRPWQELGYFAGFLRNRDTALGLHAGLLYREWARFQAFSSPQNEELEQANLGLNEIKLNPTTQFIRSFVDEEPAVDVVTRIGDQVQVRRIGWLEAAVLDEASESGKRRYSDLSMSLAKTYGQSLESVAEVITGLTEVGILLRGSSGPTLRGL